MANYQSGYGHGDVVGVPFDFYAGATLVTGSTITMQTALLVLFPSAAITGVVINLPLNPVDGALAEISNVGAVASTVTCTINANTGDSIIAIGVSGSNITSIANVSLATGGTASTTVRFRYSLNGFQPASGAAVNPRTWFRVQ
jgi:hypothetical protein